MGAPHGHVTFHGDAGWTFTTFAVDVHDPVPLRRERATGEVTNVQWFIAEEMENLDLMPEFKQVLPDLLATFKESK